MEKMGGGVYGEKASSPTREQLSQRQSFQSSKREAPADEHAHELLRHFESMRIDMDVCGRHFSDLASDANRIRALHEMYASSKKEILHGEVAQALVLSRLEKGALGTGVSVRAASEYDDYLKGADLVIDAQHMREPMVGSIDVTTNQKMIDAPAYHREQQGSVQSEGLVKKLERTRTHIDTLARFSPNDARTLLAWIAGGGLAEKRTEQNSALFQDADRITLLKYYDAPQGHELHGRPHPVVAGPKVVLSLDSMFINQAMNQGSMQERYAARLDALITLEIAGGIQAYRQYVGGLIKKYGSNALLDQYWIVSQAWEKIFDRPEQHEAITRASHLAKNDRDIATQLGHYGATLAQTFRL